MDVTDNAARVADATLRLIGRRGLDAVTYSTVAAESGVSRGLVQHLCPSRADLVTAAATRLRTRVEARLQRRLAAGDGHTAFDRLRAVLVAGIPDGDDELDEAFAAAGLLALTRENPTLQALYRRGREAFHRAVVDLLAEAGIDPREASRLLGTVADLRDAVLLAATTAPAARGRLVALLAELVAAGGSPEPP